MSGNKAPLVSVIINCYNSDKYLKEALESVINQTYENWEIIFWDNQSNDDSALYFQQYQDKRLKYFFAPEFKPLSEARNLAIEKANGEYLAFLDCDDIWYTNKLQSQIKFFTDYRDVGIVYSQFKVLKSSDERVANRLSKVIEKLKINAHEPINIYQNLLGGNFIIFSSVIIRKEIFDLSGGFSKDLVQNEDFEILLKCSKISLAACPSGILIDYRIHDLNESIKHYNRNFIENNIIYSRLPYDENLKKAINRNNVKFGLYKLLYLKEFSGFQLFLNIDFFNIILEIFKKKLVK